MKNYELIKILMELPAGYDVEFVKSIPAKEHEDHVDICVTGIVADVDSSDGEKTITLSS